jgi:hypothetical protein
MANSIAEKKAAQTDLSRTNLAVDSVLSSTAGPEIFATVASILVKQILDLREALEFYQMQFFGAQPDRGAPELDAARIRKEATEAAQAQFQEQMTLHEPK